MRDSDAIRKLRIEEMLKTKKLIDRRYQAIRQSALYSQRTRQVPKPTRSIDDRLRNPEDRT